MNWSHTSHRLCARLLFLQQKFEKIINKVMIKTLITSVFGANFFPLLFALIFGSCINLNIGSQQYLRNIHISGINCIGYDVILLWIYSRPYRFREEKGKASPRARGIHKSSLGQQPFIQPRKRSNTPLASPTVI